MNQKKNPVKRSTGENYCIEKFDEGRKNNAGLALTANSQRAKKRALIDFLSQGFSAF